MGGSKTNNRTTQLQKDESGMAMAMAVIMVALLSIMGAGLLVFATTDLNTVVETNQGQRAFEMADAGIETAKQQLASDPNADHYNGGTEDIQWSYEAPANPEGVTLSNLDGSSTTADRVNITIQSLGGGAFKVLSTGQYGVAKRRIEATFSVTSTEGAGASLPPQIGTAGNIQINGNLNLTNQILFAGGNIQMAGSKPTLNGSVGMFAGGNFDWVNYNGPDAPSSDTGIVKDAFKNWKTETRNVSNPRPYPDSQTEVPIGIGAIGKIGPSGNWSSPCQVVSGKPNSGIPDWSPMRSDANIRYFDKCSSRQFVENPTSPTQITFPFDTYRDTDGLLYYGTNGGRQAQVISTLRQKAQANGTYFTPASNSEGSPFLIAKPGFTGSANYRWPSDSSLENTVVFISFSSNPSDNNTVKTQFENSCSAPFKGTIVVENGNLLTESSMDALSGAIIVKKGPDGKGGKFTSKGSCINGYTWADSGIELQSNSPTFNTSLNQIPGFGDPGTSQVRLISWREPYE